MFRFVLGIQMVETAEELVEAMDGRQEFIAVAEVVLAELCGRVALWLEQFGDGRVLVGQPLFRRRQPDFQETGPQRALAGDECRTAGGARLLAVIIGEYRAFVGDTVDVGRVIAHHAAVVGTDVPVADVVGHDDKDVGLLLRESRCASCCRSDSQRSLSAGPPKLVSSATSLSIAEMHDCLEL